MSAGLDMIYDTLDFFLGKKPSINNRKDCETCADCGNKQREKPSHGMGCVGGNKEEARK